jgi:DNA-binding NarL/FixJ family response regulator
MKEALPRAVVIASADRLFAEAAATYLDGQPGWRTAATAYDGLTALALVGRLEPSCLLVIGDLPRVGVHALTRQLERRAPNIRVVVVGASPDTPGSLPANAHAADVLAALAERPTPREATAAEPSRDHSIALLGRLTQRERLTLTLLAAGLSRDEIARRLDVSIHTVRTHMQNLYAKLGLHSRLELVHFAGRHGLVDPTRGAKTRDSSDRHR